jgi:hypothetical protein
LKKFIAGQKYNIRPSENSPAVHKVPLYGLKVRIRCAVTTQEIKQSTFIKEHIMTVKFILILVFREYTE